MNKELQDLAWSVLPIEFKEEVKRLYKAIIEKSVNDSPTERYFDGGCEYTFKKLFGLHNLTSDAEGEEMLTVPRSKVQEMFGEAHKSVPTCEHDRGFRNAELTILRNLFGAKCLPDNVATSAPNVDSLEPKPAEPKFKVGDTASYVCSSTLKHKCTVTKVMQNKHSGKWEYNVMFEWGKPGMWIPESDLEPYKPYTEQKYHKGEKVRYNGYVYEVEGLVGKNRYALKGLNFDLGEGMIEPYTEPKEEIRKSRTFPEQMPSDGSDNSDNSDPHQSRNLSQNIANCDKQFDNILKANFSKERRLNIATQILSGIVASSKPCKHPVKRAVELADALIAECEKGGKS